MNKVNYGKELVFTPENSSYEQRKKLAKINRNLIPSKAQSSDYRNNNRKQTKGRKDVLRKNHLIENGTKITFLKKEILKNKRLLQKHNK